MTSAPAASAELSFRRHFLLPLVGIVAVLGVALLGSLLWLAAAQDRIQFTGERDLVGAAIHSRKVALERNLGDYAIWDDTVEKVALSYDPAWAGEEILGYLYGVQGYEHVFLIDGRDRTVGASDREKVLRLDAAAILGEPYRRALAELRRRPPGTDQRLTGLTTVGGRPAIFGLAAIIPSTERLRPPPGPAHYVVFAKLIDAPFLKSVGEDYRLRDLEPAPDLATADQLLRDGAGRILGGIRWSERTPGADLLLSALPVLLCLLAVIGVAVTALLRRAREAVGAVAAKSAEAADEASTARRALSDLQEAKRRLADEEARARAALERALTEVRAENRQLNARVEDERRATLAEAASAFEQTIGDVADAVLASARELDRSAQALSEIAADTKIETQAVTAGAEGASAAVRELAAAATQLHGSVGEIAAQVREQAALTGRAEQATVDGQGVVKRLAGEAGGIGAVVGSIRTIAGQTNLLALNATIEAARAGAAGAGFAVVAGEVKSLAGQTADATGSIERLVDGVQGRVEAAVASFDEVSAQVGRVSAIAAAIAGAVDEQRGASNAIGRSAARAADGAERVRGRMEVVARGVDRAGDLTTRVADASIHLAARAEQLREASGGFLRRLRAA